MLMAVILFANWDVVFAGATGVAAGATALAIAGNWIIESILIRYSNKMLEKINGTYLRRETYKAEHDALEQRIVQLEK